MKRVLFIGNQSVALMGVRQKFEGFFQISSGDKLDYSYLTDQLQLTSPDLLFIFPEKSQHEEMLQLLPLLTKDHPLLHIFILADDPRWPQQGVSSENKFLHLYGLPADVEAIYAQACSLLRVSPQGESRQRTAGGRPHVLLIDDNPTTLRTIKGMLQDFYEVTCVPSGAKGFAQLEKKRPNVILLDYLMPGMDGKQVLELIRAEEDYRDIPVIFLTSAADAATVTSLLALKPAGYLVKPPDTKKLINTVAEVLRRNRA